MKCTECQAEVILGQYVCENCGHLRVSERAYYLQHLDSDSSDYERAEAVGKRIEESTPSGSGYKRRRRWWSIYEVNTVILVFLVIIGTVLLT